MTRTLWAEQLSLREHSVIGPGGKDEGISFSGDFDLDVNAICVPLDLDAPVAEREEVGKLQSLVHEAI